MYDRSRHAGEMLEKRSPCNVDHVRSSKISRRAPPFAFYCFAAGGTVGVVMLHRYAVHEIWPISLVALAATLAGISTFWSP